LAEAVMPFFLYHAKSSFLIEVARRVEFALRLQHHFSVSSLPRESHALTYEPRTDT
jgi:hypothetical protein